MVGDKLCLFSENVLVDVCDCKPKISVRLPHFVGGTLFVSEAQHHCCRAAWCHRRVCCCIHLDGAAQPSSRKPHQLNANDHLKVKSGGLAKVLHFNGQREDIIGAIFTQRLADNLGASEVRPNLRFTHFSRRFDGGVSCRARPRGLIQCSLDEVDADNRNAD